MIVIGTIHHIGDEVAASQIFDPAHGQDDPAVYAAYCLAAVDVALAEAIQPWDILVAGRNFGHGPDADGAATSLAALELGAVVCVSAAAEFVATCNLYGVPVIIAPEAANALQSGVRARIDFEQATIKNLATGAQFSFTLDSHFSKARALLHQARQFAANEGLEG